MNMASTPGDKLLRGTCQIGIPDLLKITWPAFMSILKLYSKLVYPGGGGARSVYSGPPIRSTLSDLLFQASKDKRSQGL